MNVDLLHAALVGTRIVLLTGALHYSYVLGGRLIHGLDASAGHIVRGCSLWAMFAWSMGWLA